MKIKKIMKKACAIITAVAFAGYCSIGGVYVKASTEHSEGKVKNYIVGLNTKNALQTVKNKYCESDGINENKEEKLEENNIVPLELSEKQAEQLSCNDTIQFIEEDAVVTASTMDKRKGLWHKKNKTKHAKKEKRHKKNTSSVEWNVRMIQAADKKDSGTSPIKVAVLDSGIDWGNDINLVYQTSLVPGEEEMTQIFMDGSGHGSSVASLIAACDGGNGITGINPNVELYSYRVLDDYNGAPLSRVIEAIYMAIDQKVHIINMSFGLNQYSEALEQAVHDAAEAGILVVAAAGNTGEQGVQYPASYEEVIAVGAVDQYGTVEDYSAKGEEIEIVAPGELVRTTGFISSEIVTSGTSLAAPQVTAVASLIWQKDPEMPADFVRGLLNESANLYGDENAYGNGLLDARYALEHYEEYKKKYEEWQAGKQPAEEPEPLIAENNTKIHTFSDTGCVEGSWSRNNHEKLIDDAYFCVRAGARFPDLTGYKTVSHNGEKRSFDFGVKEPDDTRVFAGMTKNPWWHGYYATNYIKAIIYAARMADSLGTYGDTSKASNDFKYEYAKTMRTILKTLDDQNGWEYALFDMKERNKTNSKAQSQKNSNGFKRALVWGMAIHSATDTYAHSAMYKGANITHTGLATDADNIDYIRQRYIDATAVAEQMMNCYLNKRQLTARDLVMPGNHTIGYQLLRFDDYIHTVDASIPEYSFDYGTK